MRPRLQREHRQHEKSQRVRLRRAKDQANNLAVAVLEGNEDEVVQTVFEKLLDYTATHFKNEEALLKRHKYLDLDSHIKEHERLTKQVILLNRERHLRFTGNFIEFLESWLVNHILGTDMLYKDHLINKGA